MSFKLEVFQKVLYFSRLTINTEVLWIVLPLLIATIAMIVYFERYREERPGWNTYFSNSLVLLFVSIILFRYVYGIDELGLMNFVMHLSKTIVSGLVLLIGIIILFLNFKHFLPEKIAKHITSPITLNLVAYISALYVYSGTEKTANVIFFPERTSGWSIFLSLLIIFVILFIALNLLKALMKKLFLYLKKMKMEEKVEEIVDGKKPIEKKKEEIKKEEKIIRKAKKDVKKEERGVKKEKLKELDKQKKEAIKLKKIVKGVKR